MDQQNPIKVVEHAVLRFVQLVKGWDVGPEYRFGRSEFGQLREEIRARYAFARPLSNRCTALFVKPGHRAFIARYRDMIERLAQKAPYDQSVGPWGQYVYDDPRTRSEDGIPCIFVVANDRQPAIVTVIVPDDDVQPHLDDYIFDEEQRRAAERVRPPSGVRHDCPPASGETGRAYPPTGTER